MYDTRLTEYNINQPPFLGGFVVSVGVPYRPGMGKPLVSVEEMKVFDGSGWLDEFAQHMATLKNIIVPSLQGSPMWYDRQHVSVERATGV